MTKRKVTKRKANKLFSRLLTWQSPERAWQAKPRSWYVVYSFFFVLVIAVTVILQEFLLTLAIIAFVFLWFTHASIQPDIVEHTITTIGIKTFDKLYKWKQIKHYWFSHKEGIDFLNIDIIENLDKPDFMRRLSLIINPEDEEDLFFTLIEHIDYGDKEEVGYNFLTKLVHGKYTSISKYLPDEVFTQEQYLDLPKESNEKEED